MGKRHLFSGALALLAATALQAFETFPRIFPTGQPVDLSLHLTMEELNAVRDGGTVEYISVDGFHSDGETYGWWGGNEWEKLQGTPDGNVFHWTFTPQCEVEHLLRVVAKDGKVLQKRSLYSVDPDLFKLRGYRGDLHMHGINSDGHQTPFETAAYCRKAGWDFMALSDHLSHQPAVELAEQFPQFGTNLTCIPGEEIHTRSWQFHGLSLGADSGFGDWRKANEEEYDRRVAERYEKIKALDMPEHELKALAEAQIVLEVARELGGLTVFSHPFAKKTDRQVSPQHYMEELFNSQLYDAAELPNGGGNEGISYAVDKQMELAKKGIFLRPIGASDSHNQADPGFGTTYTLIFAPECSWPELAQAIKDGRSLAVWHPGNSPFINGDYRLMKFAFFLIREYYPEHNRLCKEQAELVFEQIKEASPARLKRIKELGEELKQWEADCYAPAE